MTPLVSTMVMFSRFTPRRDVVLGAGDAGGSGAVDDDLDLLDALAGKLDRVHQRRAGDDRRAVLIVVEDGNLHRLLQRLFDVEALGRLDVFQVDAAEGGLEQLAGLDDFVGILRVQLDVEDVDVGEAFEQDTLAFHDRLAGQRADVAQAEHRGAVGDDGDQVALGGVMKASCGFFSISRQGSATPGV